MKFGIFLVPLLLVSPISAMGKSACDGLSREACILLQADMQFAMDYLERKSKEDRRATDAALNKCIASLPDNFTGRSLVKCMSKDIGK